MRLDPWHEFVIGGHMAGPSNNAAAVAHRNKLTGTYEMSQADFCKKERQARRCQGTFTRTIC